MFAICSQFFRVYRVDSWRPAPTKVKAACRIVSVSRESDYLAHRRISMRCVVMSKTLGHLPLYLAYLLLNCSAARTFEGKPFVEHKGMLREVLRVTRSRFGIAGSNIGHLITWR